MKTFLLALFILFTTFAFGQSSDIKQIPGTKCSLAPPEGFEAATTFNGFQHTESGSSIMVNQIAGPYSQIAGGMVAENLAKKGMTLLSKNITDFQNGKATSIKVSQKANGINYLKEMLVFGNESNTVMVVGTYPQTAKSMGAAIHKAMFSTVYNDKQNDDPLAAANFTIDVTGSAFKLDKSMSGVISYKMDDEKPSKKPTLLAAQSIGKVVTPDLKQYTINRVNNLPGLKGAELKEINPIIIDGLKGFEVVALSTKGDATQQTYIAMLFNAENGYFIILGQSQDSSENNLKLFKRIASTFKLKK